MKKYLFQPALTEGIILSRPNRFIMLVKVGGKTEKCHCPSTGRIGNIVFRNVPCLLSKPLGREKRKTRYTVEAISPDPPHKPGKKWIGINQSRANDYIAFFLETGQLPGLGRKGKWQREVRLGKSRIDFSSGSSFIEVKTPLISLPGEAQRSENGTGRARHGRFNSFSRLIAHYSELAKAAGGKGARAALVLCYLWDAPPFSPPPLDKGNAAIRKAVKNAVARGVENWQVNLSIDASGVKLVKCFRLGLF